LEFCTVVVVVRDRFSTTEKCLQTLLAFTPAVCAVVAVIGGAPEKLRRRWEQSFGPRVRFIFKDKLLNAGQSRNIGLREVRTRLVVLMDNDVYVRKNWLEPLVACQTETRASLVVPLLLETPERIHTAANDFYITYKNGKAYANKELCFAKHTFLESSNLKCRATDYGELHCQLVVTKTALDLGIFDENMLEAGECDSGLTLKKAGHSQWFEPASVVDFDFPHRITRAEDIRPFAFKWNMREILKGYQHFRRKWDVDITGLGSFSKFLVEQNQALGLLPRLFPSRPAMAIDYCFYRLRRASRRLNPLELWRWFYKRWIGFYEWPDHPA